MKKMAIMACVFAFVLSAGVAADSSMKVVVPAEQHVEDELAKVRIEYTPSLDEVRIYYTSMYTTYKTGEAMNSVMACLQDFVKENNYYKYKYMEAPKEKSYKGKDKMKYTEYSAHVKLLK